MSYLLGIQTALLVALVLVKAGRALERGDRRDALGLLLLVAPMLVLVAVAIGRTR